MLRIDEHFVARRKGYATSSAIPTINSIMLGRARLIAAAAGRAVADQLAATLVAVLKSGTPYDGTIHRPASAAGTT